MEKKEKEKEKKKEKKGFELELFVMVGAIWIWRGLDWVGLFTYMYICVFFLEVYIRSWIIIEIN